jgi:Transposase DDE domain
MDEIKLIALYCYLCECYDKTLRWQIQRFSNNGEPEFTDVEVLTIYLFAIMEEDKRQISQIHRFASKYLRSWFPLLPTYPVYVHRLNRLADCLPWLVEQLRADCPGREVREGILLMDSMPIVTCSHKRAGKVAPNLTGKGLCPSKNLFYYGCKLHSINDSAPGKMPLPAYVELTAASEHDLTAVRPVLGLLNKQTLMADKIYCDKPLNTHLEQTRNCSILTPVKLVKGRCERLREFDKAADDLFSTWVSRFRQPIESFFNWLQEKTGIQQASKVRSENGLLVHVFGKLAAALALLVFSST